MASVSPFGEEFGVVEHRLRLQLNAPHLVISEMTNVSLKANSNSFASFSKGLETPNVVDFFVELTALGQSAHDVATTGVHFPIQKGFKFCATKIDLPPGKEEYTVVHCVAALGKVYNFINPVDAITSDKYASTDEISATNIPQGFDSLRISEKDDFMIFAPNQINTVHIFKIKGGDNIKPMPLNSLMCEVCKKSVAVLFCANDNMKLCEKCDDKVHRGNALTKKHERKLLGEVLPLYQNCPEHPGNKVQYYCTQCSLPLCMECKVTGSHSHRSVHNHKLVPIVDMYQIAGDEVNQPSKTRQLREKALTDAIIESEEKMSALQNNLKAVITEIQRNADAAIAEAKQLAGEKIIETKSSLSELQRKFDDLKKQRKLLIEYYANGEPVPFLQSLHRNALLEKEMEANDDLQKSTGVTADVSVYGRLQVSTQKSKAKEIQPVAERGLPSKTGYSTYTTSYMPSTTATHYENELKYAKYSTLDKMAERKLRKYQNSGKELLFAPFESSEIIRDKAIARKLYLSFPFKAIPETHLLFSTSVDGRDAKKMHQFIDGKGISVMIIRSGDHVFGGFAASKWNDNSTPFGESSSSFLFSINNNAFIPANPQSKDPIYLLGTPDSFSFGRDDLVVSGNFDRCSSTIENTFGVGLEFGGEAAQKFLAGAPRFKADVIEVWGFFSPVV